MQCILTPTILNTNNYNQNTYGYYYSGTTSSDQAVNIVG
jgi:hypothetical protein